jgi:hypothetical protein
MLRAHVLHRSAVSCPACRSGEYTTFRRLPAAQGSVVNRCACTRCGIPFQFVEDRSGKPIRR